jgi:hypothetical protein
MSFSSVSAKRVTSLGGCYRRCPLTTHDQHDHESASANEVVAVLRSEAGRDPHDRGLSELVGEGDRAETAPAGG